MAANYIIFGASEKSINFYCDKQTSVSHLFGSHTEVENQYTSNYRFTRNGEPVSDTDSNIQLTKEEEESGLVIIRACPRLIGGKGGFGALIRAMGMRINKGRGKDACRDLSGRRMRDVNAEKQLLEWNKKEPERKRKREQEKSKKRKEMLEGPRHFFNDPQYMQQLEENESNIDDAVKLGLKASSSKSTGETEQVQSNGKSAIANGKKTLWLGLDQDLLNSDDDEDEDLEEQNTKRQKTDQADNISIPTVPPLNATPSAETTPLLNATPQAETTPPVETDHTNHSLPTESNIHFHTEPTNQSESLPPKTAKQPPAKQSIDIDPAGFDLNMYNSVEELLSVGGDMLKAVLQYKGLKCGGTPQERAERLLSIKGKKMEEIDANLFSKGNNKRKGKNKN